jgi:hypothetical protein
MWLSRSGIGRKAQHQINMEKTEYMLLSCHQMAGQIVAQFKYLGTTVANHILIQEEFKRRLNSGNACYHSVQNLLFSRLLSKNVIIRICKTIILPVVLYWCETWSLTLREGHRLSVSEGC